MSAPVTVVGIGADGWAGLSGGARREIASCEVLMGSTRQLDLVPGAFERVPWPSPLLPALPGLLDRYADRRVCVLASGDPMFHGIGTTLVRLLGAERVRVVPHPSSVSLACARLGWALDDVAVVSLVGRPAALVVPHLHPGRRVLVLGSTPAEVAALAPRARLTVLENLGAPDERVHHDPASAGALHVLAVECGPEGGGPEGRGASLVPGRPDDAFEHDGQLTKREVRAVSLALLAPRPGELLWDVGAGAGGIAVEWCRTHPSCRAVAIEKHPERAARVTRNAVALGVPGIRVVVGPSPDALEGLATPDAVFVGGGLTAPGVVERCWSALRPGGRLVANAVTLESEAVLTAWRSRLGGELTRIEVSRAVPIGGFTGWRPQMPVTTWAVTKEIP
ncbi:precorrin-6y C5,15-methyltransferase (decarboxylating) subunit CbiE [Saccharothrix longispora]|uniref:precorrin-6y C5,15-methyltransferase (decarboxylating) subunit CbiE n=1 Tax=Saccharothrix longispora TaxID=33920 RepID=UPI0028FD58C7|nr:precorrin-6y C5,15-methyltransferase (decarboxylating) subunit CbiE [Saccharothrix longispora]MBY8847967.1 precorrin-6y C5,15-methyltransferase (decarboxylating) subunit CbiE [Saccharothrix sp. MB29]MDU0290456.1 precorrin-6y C5,15-methyltransferase (decarboxylating) subunit CbiE [Saccharothrix longispora]